VSCHVNREEKDVPASATGPETCCVGETCAQPPMAGRMVHVPCVGDTFPVGGPLTPEHYGYSLCRTHPAVVWKDMVFNGANASQGRSTCMALSPLF
jgi:hypothetical protein